MPDTQKEAVARKSERLLKGEEKELKKAEKKVKDEEKSEKQLAKDYALPAPLQLKEKIPRSVDAEETCC